jgi:flagellar motor component MotA
MNVEEELEKRRLKDQLDHHQIFTCVTNETRSQSLFMIKKHKQESKTTFSNETKARYLQELENGNEMIKEIEDILQRALPKLDSKVSGLNPFDSDIQVRVHRCNSLALLRVVFA